MKIRAAEPRKQKHDRRDAALVLQLLVENRIPSIWMPSSEQRDVRSLILYGHQWVRIRTRLQNARKGANGSRIPPTRKPEGQRSPDGLDLLACVNSFVFCHKSNALS